MKLIISMKNIGLIVLFLISSFLSKSQDQKERVKAALNKVTEQYRNTPLLSYNVEYRYSSEEHPEAILDSLEGTFKSDGNKFLSVIDQTKTVFDGEYVVVIYSQDSVIYLSKPPGTLNGNPVALLDSASKTREIEYLITENKKLKILTLNFHNDPQYKQIRYEIDNKTGWILSVTQLVNQALLYDKEVNSTMVTEGKYGIVQMIFSHYENKKFTKDIFNTGYYVKKEGVEYKAQPPYNSCKVFLGSSNL